MGFKFHETMKGTYRSKERPEQERTLFFEIDATAESAIEFFKDFTMEIDGVVTMAGVADEKPLHGTLEIAIPTRRELVYKFEFTGNDGNSYRFEGKKTDIALTTITKTMTTCYAKVYKEGEEVADALVYFDLKDLGEFLLSWKPTI